MAARRPDKAPPSFPLYYKDAYTDASFVALGWDAQGLFWRLVCWQWDDGDIPADLNLIIAIVGKPKQTRKLWPTLAGFFKPRVSDSSRLYNGRTDELREEMLEKRRRQQNGAEITNQHRNANRTLSERLPDADRGATRASRAANATATVVLPLETSSNVEGVQGEGRPSTPTAPDFAAAARTVAKIEGSGLGELPPDQIVIVWLERYGEALIIETLADCQTDYQGKHWKYLEKILTNRKDNPHERPSNRRRGSTDRRGTPREVDSGSGSGGHSTSVAIGNRSAARPTLDSLGIGKSDK